MSAWVIALGLGAGYLINKNLQIARQIETSVAEYQSTAKPAEGLSSAEVRQVQRTVPVADRYEDMNLQDLSRADAQGLVEARERAHQEVAAYESGPAIQGVYLVYDNRGV